MKLGLLGHGNMGSEVERLVNEGGKHSIVPELKDADVVIDFTSPQVILENISKVANLGKDMVVGTTGWYESLPEVGRIIKRSGTGLIYGQNFSVGANIFFQIVAHASLLLSKFDYDVYGFDIHHSGKKDSPSGTGLRIGKEILANFPSKKRIVSEMLDRQIDKEELHLMSLRGGRNPGYHQVVFDSQADSITLSHQAHGRRGFAQGALLAAEFIKGKKGVHIFDEVFK